MVSPNSKVLITGGCGFIGSHLVASLIPYVRDIVIIDNLSTGAVSKIEKWINEPNLRLVKSDLLDAYTVNHALRDRDLVFHLAANPDVKIGVEDTRKDIEQNFIATYNLLEGMRKSTHAKSIVFTSTSTIYGEAEQLPTEEDYARPLLPISLYGATKLACEATISAYCYLFDLRAVIYRFANVVGPHGHGVVQDFVRKLLGNQTVLEILGDGTQKKSYLHVDDCVEAVLFGLEHCRNRVDVFNIASEDYIDVKTVAKIVCEEMSLGEVKLKCTGGVDGGRGWKGDVKNMSLSVKKLEWEGWKPKYNSSESVRLTARAEIRRLRQVPPAVVDNR